MTTQAPDPTSDQKTETGSCLCGSIKYTLTGTPSSTVLCHCGSCKRHSGSAFMANAFYDVSQLQIISSDKAALKTYEDTAPDAGGIVERQFCGNCGSSLFLKPRKWADIIVVPMGTLDHIANGTVGDESGGQDWRPAAEFFCKRRMGFLGAGEAARFDSMT